MLLRLSCSGFHIRPTNSPLKAFDTFSRSSRITSSRAYTPSSTLDVTPKLNLIRPVRSCPRSTRSTLSFVNKSHGRTFTSATGMQTSFTDPERPDLYYHLFDVSQSSPVFALSFLPDAPTKLDSSAIIGWLPAETRSQSEQAGLNDFKENRTSPLQALTTVLTICPAKFLEVLHEAVQSGLRDGVDDIQINGAIQTQQGWMHIHGSPKSPDSSMLFLLQSNLHSIVFLQMTATSQRLVA